MIYLGFDHVFSSDVVFHLEYLCSACAYFNTHFLTSQHKNSRTLLITRGVKFKLFGVVVKFLCNLVLIHSSDLNSSSLCESSVPARLTSLLFLWSASFWPLCHSFRSKPSPSCIHGLSSLGPVDSCFLGSLFDFSQGIYSCLSCVGLSSFFFFLLLCIC